MIKPTITFKLKDGEKITGFAPNHVKPDDKEIKLIVSDICTSDDDKFHIYMKSFVNFLRVDYINNISSFLLIIHEDNVVDLYLNKDIPINTFIELNKKPLQEKFVQIKDVNKIVKISFEHISFAMTDSVVFCTQLAWKFILFFDLRREFDLEYFYSEITKVYNEILLPFFKDDLDTFIKNTQIPIVITEGKTDVIHLKKAAEKLKFNAKINYHAVEKEIGDSRLINYLKNYDLINTNQPIICMFDRDNPIIIKEHEGYEFKKWAKNIYSFCIPVPEHRREYANISIEFYYSDLELATIFDGKRLLWDNEIRKEIIQGDCKVVQIDKDLSKEYTKKVFDEDIDKWKLNGISKTIFAEKINSDCEETKCFNFSKFKIIFGILENILKDARESKEL